jgi:hypothetical protein
VSWQLVVMKSAGSVHGPGSAVDVIVAGGAFVDVTSAARTSAADVKSKTSRSNAAQTLGFAIGKRWKPSLRRSLAPQPVRRNRDLERAGRNHSKCRQRHTHFYL